MLFLLFLELSQNSFSESHELPDGTLQHLLFTVENNVSCDPLMDKLFQYLVKIRGLMENFELFCWLGDLLKQDYCSSYMSIEVDLLCLKFKDVLKHH